MKKGKDEGRRQDDHDEQKTKDSKASKRSLQANKPKQMNATTAATKAIGRTSASWLSRGAARQQHWRNYSRHAAALHTHSVAGGGPSHTNAQEEEPRKKERQRMSYHTSTRQDRTAVTLFLGLGALSATSYAASSAVRAWKEYKASLPPEEPEEPVAKAQDESATKDKESAKKQQQQQQQKGEDGKPRENIFKEWFGVGVGAKYYEGGFEDVMTRREAALILGVRESSDPKRIKDAHRKLLILNHPDTGGSTYLSGKINEAKELLLKGRMRS